MTKNQSQVSSDLFNELYRTFFREVSNKDIDPQTYFEGLAKLNGYVIATLAFQLARNDPHNAIGYMGTDMAVQTNICAMDVLNHIEGDQKNLQPFIAVGASRK